MDSLPFSPFVVGIPGYFDPVPCNWKRPPLDKAEAEMRSSVNRRILGKWAKLAHEILDPGQVRNGFYCNGRYMVCVTPTAVAPSGTVFHAGQWLDCLNNVTGTDLAELLAYTNGLSYAEAVRSLARHLDHDAGSASRSSGWTQERHPLRFGILPTPLLYGGTATYRSEDGFPMMSTNNIRCPNGDVVSLFETIWRDKRTGKVVVLETAPERPLPLYHADWLAADSSYLALIERDEAMAAACTGFSGVVTAVPGGVSNLPDADLSLLRGRSVYVRIDEKDLPYLPRIAYALEAAGVRELQFYLTGFQRPLKLHEAQDFAGRKGIALLPPPAAAQPLPALQAIDAVTFRDQPLPERGYVLDPIIPEQGLALIYASPGMGKSHFALSMAQACATGGTYLKWKAPKPLKVLYVDGEMSARDLQTRIRSFQNASTDQFNRNLLIVTPDLAPGPMPDIGTKEGQEALAPSLKDVSLLILDNLSALSRSGGENAGEAWVTTLTWLLGLKRAGTSVLLVHHAGKNGSQRGTSRRLDHMDTVVALKRPDTYSPKEGARFEIHFVKSRGFNGEAAEPFEARLENISGEAMWTMKPVEGDVHATKLLYEALRLFNQGLSVRNVASILGISKSAAGRLRKQLIEEGWFDPDDGIEADAEV